MAVSRLRYYVLGGKDGHTPLATDSVSVWGRCFEDGERRRVALTVVAKGVGVSTVFLGIDHGFSADPDARPVLFETMCFGGPLAEEQDCYCTWEEAAAGHEAMVARAREALGLTGQTQEAQEGAVGTC